MILRGFFVVFFRRFQESTPSMSHSYSEWYSVVWLQPSHRVHSKPTLGRGRSEPKNPAMPLLGFEPATFQPVIRCANHYATGAGKVISLFAPDWCMFFQHRCLASMWQNLTAYGDVFNFDKCYIIVYQMKGMIVTNQMLPILKWYLYSIEINACFFWHSGLANVLQKCDYEMPLWGVWICIIFLW